MEIPQFGEFTVDDLNRLIASALAPLWTDLAIIRAEMQQQAQAEPEPEEEPDAELLKLPEPANVNGSAERERRYRALVVAAIEQAEEEIRNGPSTDTQ